MTRRFALDADTAKTQRTDSRGRLSLGKRSFRGGRRGGQYCRTPDCRHSSDPVKAVHTLFGMLIGSLLPADPGQGRVASHLPGPPP